MVGFDFDFIGVALEECPAVGEFALEDVGGFAGVEGELALVGGAAEDA